MIIGIAIAIIKKRWRIAFGFKSASWDLFAEVKCAFLNKQSNPITVINVLTICINTLLLRLLTASEIIINCNEVASNSHFYCRLFSERWVYL